LPPLVGSADISKKARVTVIRNKRTKVIKLKLENLPEDEESQSEVDVSPKEDNVLGMSVTNLTDAMRKKWEIKKYGVLVHSVEQGKASKSGIRSGDILMQFDGVNIKDTKHIKSLLAKASKDRFISVLINRSGSPIFLALKK
jgi:serine protease Do